MYIILSLKSEADKLFIASTKPRQPNSAAVKNSAPSTVKYSGESHSTAFAVSPINSHGIFDSRSMHESVEAAFVDYGLPTEAGSYRSGNRDRNSMNALDGGGGGGGGPTSANRLFGTPSMSSPAAAAATTAGATGS